MSAMYCGVGTQYRVQKHDTLNASLPHMFGRVPTRPIDVIMGLPSADVTITAQEYTQKTVENLSSRMNLQGKTLAK